MVRRQLSLILLTVLSFDFMGCHVVRINMNRALTPEDVAFIVPARTTFAEVITNLGAPDAIAESETGIVATYRFLDVKYSRVNFGWLLKPWSPVDPDLIISRTGLATDALEVLCDPHWVVTHWSFRQHLSNPRFNPYPF